jgi:O-Antigen ligase
VPEYWTVCAWLTFCYVPKTAYVCFCVPTFAATLGLMKRNFAKGHIANFPNLVYALTFMAVIFVFTAENIKNGILYCIILFAIFLIIMLFEEFKKNWLKNTSIFVIGIGLVMLILGNHLARNDSWKTFFSDAKVAVQIDKFQQWKRIDDSALPTNDLGREVSGTNYERITWAINGAILIAQNPFGYGLIERSFGRLGQIRWPGSHLTQSHSGWIDLTLGIGIPGVAMIVGALILSWIKVASLKGGLGTSLGAVISWILFALLLIWFTTEISQKVFFDDLVFWISLAAGFSLVGEVGFPPSSVCPEDNKLN